VKKLFRRENKANGHRSWGNFLEALFRTFGTCEFSHVSGGYELLEVCVRLSVTLFRHLSSHNLCCIKKGYRSPHNSNILQVHRL